MFKNRHIKTVVVIFSLFLFVSYVNANGYIGNPVSFYFEKYGFDDGEKLLRCELDINSDGVNELFLSPEITGKDNHGRIWTAFVNDGIGWKIARIKANGVIEDHGIVQFHIKAFYVGYMKESKPISLVTYYRGGSGSGSLGLYTLKDGVIEETLIKNFKPNDNSSKISKLLFSRKKLIITKIDQP